MSESDSDGKIENAGNMTGRFSFELEVTIKIEFQQP